MSGFFLCWWGLFGICYMANWNESHQLRFGVLIFISNFNLLSNWWGIYCRFGWDALSGMKVGLWGMFYWEFWGAFGLCVLQFWEISWVGGFDGFYEWIWSRKGNLAKVLASRSIFLWFSEEKRHSGLKSWKLRLWKQFELLISNLSMPWKRDKAIFLDRVGHENVTKPFLKKTLNQVCHEKFKNIEKSPPIQSNSK